MDEVNLDENNKKLKSLNLWIVLLMFLVLVVSGMGFYYLRLTREGREERSANVSPTPRVEAILPSPTSPYPDRDFALPVKEESVAKGKQINMEYGVEDWGVMLPEGEPVFAGFSGTIDWSGTDSLKVIVLKGDDGRLEWKYILNGEVMVQRGQKVERGQEIGKASLDSIPTYDVNLIIQGSYGGKRVSLNNFSKLLESE